MEKHDFINKEINKLIENGSNINDIEALIPSILKRFDSINEEDPMGVIEYLSDEIKEKSIKFFKFKK